MRYPNDFKNLPEDEQLESLKEVYRGIFLSSLYKTCKVLLGYEDTNPDTHGDMIDALESKSTRKLIVMPRGTFKSSIGVVGYSIWSLMKDPNKRILIDSEVYDNSKNFLREIKSHLLREELTGTFGEFKSDNWNEGEITIRQRYKYYKEASITVSGISANKTGQHYDLIICDDLNSDKNSATPEGRKKVIKHHQMNYAILEPEGTYVVIGTRYATDDVIGHILENEIDKKDPP